MFELVSFGVRHEDLARSGVHDSISVHITGGFVGIFDNTPESNRPFGPGVAPSDRFPKGNVGSGQVTRFRQTGRGADRLYPLAKAHWATSFHFALVISDGIYVELGQARVFINHTWNIAVVGVV